MVVQSGRSTVLRSLISRCLRRHTVAVARTWHIRKRRKGETYAEGFHADHALNDGKAGEM